VFWRTPGVRKIDGDANAIAFRNPSALRVAATEKYRGLRPSIGWYGSCYCGDQCVSKGATAPLALAGGAMSKLSLALVLVSSLVVSVARADESEGMPAKAFVFEARLQGAFNLLGEGFFGSATLIPTITLGARIADRLHLGVDFFVTNFTASSGNGSSSNSLTAFAIGPIVELDIVKAARNRVAFYGKVALLPGAAVDSRSGASNSNTFFLGLDLGLGVRYAPVRFFAVGTEAGALTLFIDPGSSGSASISAFYAGFVGTFLYGR
jgi:hypothetical protein